MTWYQTFAETQMAQRQSGAILQIPTQDGIIVMRYHWANQKDSGVFMLWSTEEVKIQQDQEDNAKHGLRKLPMPMCLTLLMRNILKNMGWKVAYVGTQKVLEILSGVSLSIQI